ncbi:TPA: MerR family transcriptional regulator, partial [Legionella pneumophila subsp. pneumophila]|nr:MerR family transcriptional regulator [Legionella pneumophila subsp. pneumophila]
KETYLGLGKMYLDHPDFRLFYNKYHPGLVDYLVAAMRVFAERKLS